MKINTVLILCAGFGKRLNPITLEKPKPLLEINNVTVLEKNINLIKELGINRIIINTFYLKDHFFNFIKNNNLNVDIEIVEDGENILDTGGGILNMINNSREDDFIVFNPDTIWSKEYYNEILKMEEIYFLKKFKKDKTKKFINDFEILSVVRNLKIIGIFMRLAERDNKKKYKKMIPYAWQMINYRMKNNIEFKNLKSLLKSNFPKFIK